MPQAHPSPLPEIGVFARLRARRMRFEEQPDAKVGFRDGPGVVSASESERENLPDRVAAGEEYDDARIDYRLTARAQRRPRPPRR